MEGRHCEPKVATRTPAAPGRKARSGAARIAHGVGARVDRSRPAQVECDRSRETERTRRRLPWRSRGGAAHARWRGNRLERMVSGAADVHVQRRQRERLDGRSRSE